MNFEFNEAEMRRIAEEAIVWVAAEQTEDLDRLHQQYAGQPIEVIRPALQQLFASYDGNITEPELSEWAQMISDGVRIEMKPESINWSR